MFPPMVVCGVAVCGIIPYLALRSSERRGIFPSIPMSQSPSMRVREPALDDPARRVRYLKQFCAVVRNAKSLRGLEGGLENIRADLAGIQSEAVRNEARARLDRTVGASFLALERAPERFATTLRDGLQDVVAYLERNDR